MIDVENMRRHYARTCALWSERFEAKAEVLRTLAGEKRYRIWQIYLAGCSHAFEHDLISIYQIVCRKAGGISTTLPWSRRYMYQAQPNKCQ